MDLLSDPEPLRFRRSGSELGSEVELLLLDLARVIKALLGDGDSDGD
jgi:hypothetical protein